MNNTDIQKQYTELGQRWLRGEIVVEEWTMGDKVFKLNPKQIDFINSKERFLLSSGGMGCVHGDTKIRNADTNEDICIKDIKKPLRVYSWNGIKLVKAFASIPVKYNKTDLYEVITTKGRFVATKNHRVLTEKGYVRVGELAAHDRSLSFALDQLPTTSVSFLSRLLSSGLHLTQKLLSSLSYYQRCLRLYGRQPRFALNTDQGSFPPPDGVLAHNQLYSYVDGREKELKHTFPSQYDDHRSTLGSSLQEDHQHEHAVDYTEAIAFERTLVSFQLVPKFLLKFFFRLRIALTKIYNSYNHSITIPEIVQIRYHSFDYFYDLHVFGTNNYYAEGTIHHNSGKTLAFLIKLVLLCMWFPNNRILLGKKSRQGIDLILLPDLFDLIPPSMYKYNIKVGIISFFNGSEIILKGLDALQSGAGQDIKKAEQDIKGLNLGGYFIDQLEEIEERVFRALDSRMRNQAVPFRQSCSTTNPANYWAYDYFKAHPRPDTKLIESSMLDNKDNLPPDYIESQLNNPESYVRRYVYGDWSLDTMTEASVFPKEYITYNEFFKRKPIRTFDGIEIFEEPDKNCEYQIAVDPSEGSVDPCSIMVVNVDTGYQAAKFNAFVPLNVVSDKTVDLAYMYTGKTKPWVLIETGGGGTAVIENVKMRWNKLYERETFNYYEKSYTKKLGFQTNHATKKLLIDNFLLLLKAKYVKIRDAETLNEMRTFIYSNEAQKKGAGANKGFHDDNVMALMMAYWGIKPKTPEEQKLRSLLNEKQKSSKKKYQFI